MVPDLQIGLTARPQNFFPFELQLLGQGADGLIERVDLMVQIGDSVLPAVHLLFQVRYTL